MIRRRASLLHLWRLLHLLYNCDVGGEESVIHLHELDIQQSIIRYGASTGGFNVTIQSIVRLQLR